MFNIVPSVLEALGPLAPFLAGAETQVMVLV